MEVEWSVTIMATSLPGRLPLPSKIPLIGGEVVPSGGMENGEEKNLTNLF